MKTFPLDHFGAASNEALRVLQQNVTNRQGRRKAFRMLRDLAKLCKAINFEPVYIGVQTDMAGGQWLTFAPATEDDKPSHIPRKVEVPAPSLPTTLRPLLIDDEMDPRNYP